MNIFYFHNPWVLINIWQFEQIMFVIAANKGNSLLIRPWSQRLWSNKPNICIYISKCKLILKFSMEVVQIYINPFMPNGIPHYYQLDQSIYVLSVVRLYFSFLSKLLYNFLQANSGHPDQTPSNLSLHCLSVSQAKLKWVNDCLWRADDNLCFGSPIKLWSQMSRSNMHTNRLYGL